MHMSKIKNRVVATAVATTVACSNVGMLVHADEVNLTNTNNNIVKTDVKQTQPVIHAEDVYVELGSKFDIREGVEATAVDGTVISDLVEVDGVTDFTMDTSRERRQTVLYKVTSDGKTVYKSRDIYVVSPSKVKAPNLSIDEYANLKLVDNGFESTFSNTKFTNKGWAKGYYDVQGDDTLSVVKKGDKVITSEGLDYDKPTTVSEFEFNVEKDGILKIGVSMDGLSNGKVGKVYVNGVEVYNRSTSNLNAIDTYEEVSVPVNEGKVAVKFEYSISNPVVGDVDNGDRMYIHSIALDGNDLLKGVTQSDKLEYRINNGEWVEYTDVVDLKQLDRNDKNLKEINVDARATTISHLGDVESSLSSEIIKLFAEPTLNASDVTLKVGDTFKEKEGVTAYDGDSTDISADVEVVTSNVDTKKAGIYNITYKITNKKGVTVYKTVKVTVESDGANKGESPVINLPSDSIELMQGDKFDELKGVTATDKEDGTITDKIVVAINTVDTNTPGKYMVVYTVADKQGNIATKTLNVEVKENKGEVPVIEAEDKEIDKGSVFDPYYGISATDKEDGSISNAIKIVSNNVDTSQEGEYSVVYEVTDSNGNKTTKTVKITVKEGVKVEGEAPMIHASDKTVSVGTTVNVLEGVTATDKEDGDITNKLEVVSNPLNTQIAGKYTVQLGVKDSAGNVTVKNVVYTVVANTTTDGSTNNGTTNNGTTNNGTTTGDVAEADKPIINATDIVIPLGMNMAYILEGVTATDSTDGNISSKVQIKSTNIDFDKEGDYKVTFIVNNSKGVSTEKEINVRVSANATLSNGNESANGNTANTTTENNGGDGANVENVKTFDNVTTYFGTFIISMLSSVGLFLKVRKRD